MEKEFSAEAMRLVSVQAAAANMQQKYKEIVELIHAAAQQGETQVVIDRETTEFSYELFDWLSELGFRLTYIRQGYDIKSDFWENSYTMLSCVHAHWVRIAW